MNVSTWPTLNALTAYISASSLYLSRMFASGSVRRRISLGVTNFWSEFPAPPFRLPRPRRLTEQITFSSAPCLQRRLRHHSALHKDSSDSPKFVVPYRFQ